MNTTPQISIGIPIVNVTVHRDLVFVVTDATVMCYNADSMKLKYTISPFNGNPKYVCVNDFGVFSVKRDTLYKWSLETGEFVFGNPFVVKLQSDVIDLEVVSFRKFTRDKLVICMQKANESVVVLYNCRANSIAMKGMSQNLSQNQSRDESVLDLFLDGAYKIVVTNSGVFRSLVKSEDSTRQTIYSGNVFTYNTFDTSTRNLFLRIGPTKYRRVDLATSSYIDYLVPSPQTFCPYNGVIFTGHKKLKKLDYMGNVFTVYPEIPSKLTFVCAGERYVFVATDMSTLTRFASGFLQEDLEDNLETRFTQNDTVNPDVAHCKNTSLITLSEYTALDDPVQVYLQDSRGRFGAISECFTIDEFKASIQADKTNPHPLNVMAICTRPGDMNTRGLGAKPTHKIVVKLPVQNIYVTLGSMFDMIRWGGGAVYAIPMFGGKRRRLTNLKGIFGVSMNHCQTPGSQVYKLYRRETIAAGTVVGEDEYDFLQESVIDLLNQQNGIFTEAMIQTLLDSILGS